MSHKKRVFDKDLGVEFVLDEDDEINESKNSDKRDGEMSRSGRKRARFDPTVQQSSHVSASSQRPSPPAELTSTSIQTKRVPSVISSQPSRVESTDASSPNEPSRFDEDHDVESGSENFEDIDYGDDDDDDYHTQSQSNKDLKTSRHNIFGNIGDDDDEDDDVDDDNDDEHENRRSSQDTNEDDDEGDDRHERPDGDDGQEREDKSNVDRCKYWPSCTSGDSCAYYHPSKPCRAFPNCRFGQKCLYIHPSCKFGIHCTKPNCPFAHPMGLGTARRQPPPPSHFKANQKPLAPKCRYGFNCANSMCKFSHQRSETCRFGSNCLLEGCSFTHPSDVARKKPSSAFKWNAQS